MLALEQRNKKKEKTQAQKNLFTMTSGGFVIVVRNNSFKIAFFRAYLVTILKALLQCTIMASISKWLLDHSKDSVYILHFVSCYGKESFRVHTW